MWKYILILTIAFCLILFKNQAQDYKVIRDFITWTSIELEKEFFKCVKLSLEEEIRLYQNSSKFEYYHTDIGIHYYFLKYAGLGVNWRYFHENNYYDSQLEKNMRLNADLFLKYKISKIRLAYRLRYQTDDGINEIIKSDKIIRNKLGLKYKIPNTNIKTGISTEIFYKKNQFKTSSFYKIWITPEISYSFNNQELKCYYRFENEINAISPYKYHIFGIKYTFKL